MNSLPEQTVAEVPLIAEPRFHKYALFYVPRFAELRWKVRLDHEDIERLCREGGRRLRVSETTLRKLDKQRPVSLKCAGAAFDIINDEYQKRYHVALREEEELLAAIWQIPDLHSARTRIQLGMEELARLAGVPTDTITQLERGQRVTKATASLIVETIRLAYQTASAQLLPNVALLSTKLVNGETPRAATERWRFSVDT